MRDELRTCDFTEIAVCQKHRCEYIPSTGVRDLDCPRCRQEEAERAELMARIEYYRREEKMKQREQAHLQEMEAIDALDAEQYAAWSRWLIQAITTVLLLTLLFGLWMAAQNRAMRMQNDAKQEQRISRLPIVPSFLKGGDTPA